MRRRIILTALTIALFMVPGGLQDAMAKEKPFIFGVLLVGPYNDRGWSQAHYEAGLYVERKVPGSKMIYLDKVNPADRPGLTLPQLVDDLVAKGARLIIANSDDMKDGIREAAKQHPGIAFIHISGDDVLTGKAPANLGNIMGRMEYAKMMAGFVAALTTNTGKIGYLGPLINEETRRLAVSAYLGAAYGWQHVRKKPLSELKFKVSWIGFWFNIPGVTADPTQVVNRFYDSGFDVVLSGIDTTEALVVAGQKRRLGRQVWAIPYDYKGACEGADAVCLGVPYFNWGPAYARTVRAVRDGTWKPSWDWNGPDWQDINSEDSSAVGFEVGPAISPETARHLEEFIQGLAAKKIRLFQGPLFYQDGSVFLKPGEVAIDRQIWYMPQLLQGMEGASSAK
ncbi:MAG: BMP family ABC transporter substrate-binding protein [Deltaproteobacteria bacterium]|nr:BMP family ABC transporter substrate-binding protein [Deltaproteobacteria bacterium]MBW2072432.1 BMP family ABC transporter substrate-binding protein [Deltaproteobacteria bacterium]